jgi:hypothetical protein
MDVQGGMETCSRKYGYIVCFSSTFRIHHVLAKWAHGHVVVGRGRANECLVPRRRRERMRMVSFRRDGLTGVMLKSISPPPPPPPFPPPLAFLDILRPCSPVRSRAEVRKERVASGSSGSSWPSEQWFGITVGRIPGANLACMRTAAGLLGRAPKKSRHPVQAPEESIIGQDSLSNSRLPRTLLTRRLLAGPDEAVFGGRAILAPG